MSATFPSRCLGTVFLLFLYSRSLPIQSRMYGEQLRSVMPAASQLPRNRTASTSTKFRSSKSSAIFDSLSLICFSNSGRCSARIRPISRIFVRCPSQYFSIFKVMFDPSGNSRLQQRQSHCHSYLVDLLVFRCWSQAVISAFAENSA
jgi:hypothetical protein